MAWNSCLHQLRTIVSATGVVLLLVGSRPAAGDPAKDVKQEAKAHFTAAQSHYNLNEFEDALREFKEAYRLYPDAVFLFNLGQCERQLGHAEEAIRFYRSYLREQPKAANRQDVLDKIAELESSLEQKRAEPEQPPPPEPSKPPEPTEEPTPAVAPVPAILPAPGPGAPAPTAPPPSPPAQPLSPPPPLGSQGASTGRLDLTATPEQPGEPAPVYKRWWFWTVTAAAAVAVGVGIGVYVAASGNGTAIPPSALGSKKVF